MTIYEQAEDSFFLSEEIREFIKKNREKINLILDMGSGSGIQAEAIIDSGIKKENIYLVDIDPDSIDYLHKFYHNVIQSDLFENVNKNLKFDLIVFNPPYLPKDNNYHEPQDSELATTGGIKGNEIINKFLSQAKNYLSKNGAILLLTSSLTRGIVWKGYKKKKIAKKDLFFEKLYVWEIRLE